jgi:hypothetical protein
VTECPICRTPLEGAFCPRCDLDIRSGTFRLWLQYVDKFRNRLSAIATAAQEVCEESELELLGATLLEWSDERIAGYFEITQKEVKARREAIYEKIRTGMGDERIAELSRRRPSPDSTT